MSRNRLELLMQGRGAPSRKGTALRNALLQDPDIADYVARLLGDVPALDSRKSLLTSGNGNGHNLSNLTLKPAIKLIAEGLPDRFVIQDLVDVMTAGGFDFGKRIPVEAVRDCVYTLCRGEDALFMIAEKGQGGKPNTYAKI